MRTGEPTTDLAREIVTRRLGRTPGAVRRFPTGLQHFVYEASFDAAAPVVVRISRPGDRGLAESAARLSRQLRPMGVPLPELIADGAAEPYPYLILERLPGVDLGEVAATLSSEALDRVAARVVEAQGVVATLPSAGRYGYAAEPRMAPFRRWSDVLETSIARSRRRIAAAALYDERAPDALTALLERLRPELDSVAAIPFLHDTTTKNVIVTAEGGFSGIVDVDDLCYGDCRLTMALTLASLTAGQARGGPQAYVRAWMKRAGAADDAVFRFYVAVCLCDFMGEQGQTFNGASRGVSPQSTAALAAAFDAALDMV